MSFFSSTGTVYIIPVFGGYVADSFAGKFNTILGSGLIYVLGKTFPFYHHHFLSEFSRQQIDIFLIFLRKKVSAFHADCLLRSCSVKKWHLFVDTLISYGSS